MSYTLLRNTTTTLATWSGISTGYEAYGWKVWKPTEITEEQCFRPRARWKNEAPTRGKRERRLQVG